MKICVLSDTRLPTSAQFAGHGLGKINLAISEGLQARGHDVTLYAGVGSVFAGKLITADDERDFTRMDLSGYDAILDAGHYHTLQKIQPELPVANLSQDREAAPGRNALFPSAAHRAWHGYNERNGKIVYNGVVAPAKPTFKPSKPYFAYLSMFHKPKGALMAFEAARMAGARIVFAGPTPPAPPPGSEYIGPLSGVDKFNFLAGATALLFPSGIEAAPVTPLEAQSVGCPVIVSAYGAAKENMLPDVTGYVVRDTTEMADAIGRIDQIDREQCRQWIIDCRGMDAMIDGYEAHLKALSEGTRW